MSRVLVLAAMMTMLVTGVPGGSAAGAARADVPIQPGAPIISRDYSTPSYCTMNFVLADTATRSRRTYIGASATCFSAVGARAEAPGIGAFGTVVFRQYGSGHFALIRVDDDKLRYVSKVMRGYGKAPTGYTRSGETHEGDPLVTHGHACATTAPGVTRYGVLARDTPTSYTSAMQPHIQDIGSPVVRLSDGKALGISNEVYYPIGHATVEGIIEMLANAGFSVTLGPRPVLGRNYAAAATLLGG